MHRRCPLDIGHLRMRCHIEPHRQILGQPFRAIFGLFGSVIVQHQISARQRCTVLHAPIVQHCIKRGMPLPYREATYKLTLVVASFSQRIAQSDSAILLHHRHLLCQTAIIAPIVIAIAEGNKFTPCSLHASAIIRSPTDIFGRCYQGYFIGIAVCKSFAYPQSIVTAAIFAQDYLHSKVALLRKYRIECLRQVWLVIVGGNDDRDKRCHSDYNFVSLANFESRVFSSPDTKRTTSLWSVASGTTCTISPLPNFGCSTRSPTA